MIKKLLLLFSTITLQAMEQQPIDNNIKIITRDNQVFYIPRIAIAHLTNVGCFPDLITQSRLGPILMDVSYQELVCMMPFIWEIARQPRKDSAEILDNCLKNFYGGENVHTIIANLDNLYALAGKIGFIKLESAAAAQLLEIQEKNLDDPTISSREKGTPKTKREKEHPEPSANNERKKRRDRMNKHLDLSNGRIELLGKLRTQDKILLHDLNLKNNQLTKIPPSLFSLSNLTNLHLAHNQLEDIEALKNLAHLKDLRLQYNRISLFPILVSVCSLYLQHNQIQEIPEEVTLLKNLKILYISDNPLTTINNKICLLNLKTLAVERTSLNPISKNLIQELKKRNVAVLE